ncbi:MAG: hypothetical protein H0W83_02735 [Planctomycetes bacterium]|nr:hypothetical protein [Planctomycetota bacterium]
MATTTDADVILKLYDLRRESVCRKAREFFISWVPATAEEAKLIGTGFGRQDNAYVRQAATYWEMAFSIANLGAVDNDLFAKNCGEGLIFTLKCQHLKQKFPDAWTRTMPEGEAFLAGNAHAKQRAEAIRKRHGW